LQGGDQAVAPESGRVPGDTGIGVTALRRIRHQHREIGGGAAEDLVETIIRGFDRGALARLLAHFPARRDQPAQERRRPCGGLIAAHGKKGRPHLTRLEVKVVDGAIGCETIRLRIEGERRAPHPGVQAVIDQQHLVGAAQLRRRVAPQRDASRGPRTGRQNHALAGHQIGIGQIDDERRIVIAQIGAEQERWRVVHQQFEAREVPRVLMEQAGGSA